MIIQCIDITMDYQDGAAGQLWVFLNMETDEFLLSGCGHVFNREEIEKHPQVSKLRALILAEEKA